MAKKGVHHHIIGPFPNTVCAWCSMGEKPLDILEELVKIRKLLETLSAQRPT